MDETALKEQNQMSGNIPRVRQETGLAVWAERIRECRSGGYTATAYCRRNGIDVKAYYYHLRKLRERMGSESVEQIPVRIGTLQSTAKPASVTVHDTSGIVVEIADGTSSETVMSVIKALKC